MTRATRFPTPMPASLLRLIVVIVLAVWFGGHCPHPIDGSSSAHHDAPVTSTLPSQVVGHAPLAAPTDSWRSDHGHAPEAQCWSTETVSARLARATQGLLTGAMSGQPLTLMAVSVGGIVLTTLAMLAACVARAPSQLGVMRH